MNNIVFNNTLGKIGEIFSKSNEVNDLLINNNKISGEKINLAKIT